MPSEFLVNFTSSSWTPWLSWRPEDPWRPPSSCPPGGGGGGRWRRWRQGEVVEVVENVLEEVEKEGEFEKVGMLKVMTYEDSSLRRKVRRRMRRVWMRRRS